MSNRVAAWAAVVLAVAAGGLLSVAAYGGLSVRPAADDWCVAWRERDLGLSGLVSQFYNNTNGRVGNAALSGILYSEGLRGPRLLPAVLAVTLSLGTFLVFRAVLQRAGWQCSPAILVAASLGLAAITFFAGEVPYQVFFWAAASISHTVPVILGLFTLLVALRAESSPSRWVRLTAVVVAVVVAFAVSTVGEPFAVVSAVYATAVLVLDVLRIRRNREPFAFVVSAGWLLGIIAGLALEYTSPGLRNRRANNFHSSVLSGSGISDISHGWVSTWQAIATQPAYYGVLAIGLVVGAASSPTNVASVRWGRLSGPYRAAMLIVPVILSGVSSLGVIAALYTGYGPNGWRYERTWTTFLFPALVTATLYAALLGRVLVSRIVIARPVLAAAMVLAVALGVASVATLMPRTWHLTSATMDRAPQWDKENAKLRREVRRGATVVAFTPLRIAGSTEPFTYRVYSQDWSAGCVSRYYHVDRLRPAKSWLASDASAAYRGKG